MSFDGNGLRRSNRRKSGSGSEYTMTSPSNHDEPMEDFEQESPEKPVIAISQRGRKHAKMNYAESGGEEPDDFIGSGAHSDESEPIGPRTKRRNGNLDAFVTEDEEEEQGLFDGNEYGRRVLRSRRTKQQQPKPQTRSNTYTGAAKRNGPSEREKRLQRRQRQQAQDNYSPGNQTSDTHPDSDIDAEGEVDDNIGELIEDQEQMEERSRRRAREQAEDEEDDGKPYSLRQRQRINYAIPPPLEEMPRPPPSRPPPHRKKTRPGPGWSANGTELGRWMGMGGPDDSDSDNPGAGVPRTPRKPVAMGFSSTPGNMGNLGLGKVGDAALADADPLGVNQNVTFDEVGGLDEHIHALKEMTLLPLLYPEVFQQFKVTPPRGVLFHGPPGTGKTLLARALAASCRTNGRQITFFMRKGADILSKWVGEAERQLRLLFEEARAHQPSIIFFDEIDGLAPVRSSKQDQIHASIVATLLALMDGMDGRGSVVVIGATNRPDAIDPALRRPGRFDREFYFALPGAEAREKILNIMTKGWKGWDSEEGRERLKGLASMTKGYGGADLRALCTEAALNAVQRRYPQIYKTSERLLLKPDTIEVGLRDFMISIKKLVPSAARSSSSVATPLPQQLVPLLGDPLERVKSAIAMVLPVDKKLSALEEAEFEDVGGEAGALEREMTMQSMASLRLYRPRVVLYGAMGMGQTFVGAAALHHLEGYHVQSLELGALLSDSTRTPEAAIVQLFVEAKRHAPAVIYIPALLGWCAAVSETSRATVRAMLDTLAPSDPVLLLAVVDGAFGELPKDVRGWFGVGKSGRVQLDAPNSQSRHQFFSSLIKDLRRPPNEYADGMPRRKRVLEVLEIAPPIEPRKPSAAELAVQEENDQRVLALLKYRLEPILTALKRKFKRFTKRATEEYSFETVLMEDVQQQNDSLEVVTTSPVVRTATTQHIDVVGDAQPLVNGHVNGIVPELEQPQLPPPPPPAPEQQTLYDIDLERMHTYLYKGRYLTPDDFLEDVRKMVHNAATRQAEDIERLYKAQAMLTATEVSMHEFDPQLRLEWEAIKAAKDANKGKEKESGNASGSDAPAGTRRSARNNGLQPELTITDPVQLERRLKRQRSDGAGTDSHGGSADEGAGGPRGLKRSRTGTVNPDESDDPLDTLPTVPTVHFELQQGSEQMAQDPFITQTRFSPPPVASTSSMSIQSLLIPMPDSDPVAPSSPSPRPKSLEPEPQPEQPPVIVSEPTLIIEVERTPTPPPPLPDFVIDDMLVSELEAALSDSTAGMSIEQLEQLRATCVGKVWHHRTEWDRTPAARELLQYVSEFVRDVKEDEMDFE
ncbi:AAA-domain-containing protein [Mycena indigotica]|uniref:AAA-domain-containing protein n=1 Tax=Mycena indigotica TaxID=2126181 RepID=A0A8H6SJU8_9AGAR|nr:AAA-domain-containing protein [Mycena indigotica]KAF7301025.1 AAA-domain-containing protein [Mycena indigotica]